MVESENVKSEKLKILIADDSKTDRTVLEKIIHQLGYHPVVASNGKEAIDLYLHESPSIILMDALMPEVDGFEATRKIRSLAGENFVFILFLTSLNDDYSLVSCLEAGGDDVLFKPYQSVVLAAKIQAYQRMLEMHQTMQRQRDEIARNNDHLLRERLIAKKVFDNIAHRGCLEADNIRHMLSPMSVFNGDMLIASRSPSGALIVLLGDFSGHGLPAAIGAVPTSEIFYTMVVKSFGIENILREINQKLKAILPLGFCCCASIMEIDYSQQTIKVWNGGLPDVMLKQKTGEVKRLKSTHMPLGILSIDEFEADCELVEMQLGDRVYVFSDSLINISNKQGELLGTDSIYELLADSGSTENLFEHLIESACEFMGESKQADDLTALEVTMVADKNLPEVKAPVRQSALPGARDWAFSFELFNETVRDFDLIPLILHATMEIRELNVFSHDLHTIFAELISNAIDHGLLGLDSALKHSSEGFQTYYRLRNERLNQMLEPNIKVSLRHQPEGSGGVLTIEVKDSGDGFDSEANRAANGGLMPGESEFSGRGIPLLKNLCESVDYLGNGNTVRIRYRWQPSP